MKKLALFAVLCVSVIGFSVGCSDDTATDTPAATEGNGDAAAPAATEGSDTSEPAAPAE